MNDRVVFAVYDRIRKEATVYPSANTADFVRTIVNFCEVQPNTVIARRPEDFEYYKLGGFADDGSFVPAEDNRRSSLKELFTTKE